MRARLLAVLPLLLAAAPPAERRPVIDDAVPKQSFMVDCSTSYQRPCLCKGSASVPPATCGWGESCVAQATFAGCTKGEAKADDTKK